MYFSIVSVCSILGLLYTLRFKFTEGKLLNFLIHRLNRINVQGFEIVYKIYVGIVRELLFKTSNIFFEFRCGSEFKGQHCDEKLTATDSTEEAGN